MFLRKQNSFLNKSYSTDESLLPMKRNIFGSLVSLNGDDAAGAKALIWALYVNIFDRCTSSRIETVYVYALIDPIV